MYIQFGAFIRQEREAKGITLRRFAEMVGVSPTYLSKVERDDFDPPTSERVLRIAELLEIDPDFLLALASHVPEDLAELFKSRPKSVAMLLRRVQNMSDAQIEKVARDLGQETSRPRKAPPKGGARK